MSLIKLKRLFDLSYLGTKASLVDWQIRERMRVLKMMNIMIIRLRIRRKKSKLNLNKSKNQSNLKAQHNHTTN